MTMKKTQQKDLFRNIRKQWVSFLSIVIIATMGITTFLGIDYTVFSLRKNGSNLYNELNFRDVEVLSTLLFTKEDLKQLQEVEGVTDVEPVRAVSAEAISRDVSEDVNVVSVTERINRVQIVSGRLPTGDSECAVEKQLAETMGVQVGAQMNLLTSNVEKVEYLKESDFTVVGIINHPDHTNTIVQESPYVLVTYNAFDAEALSDCFMKAEIVIEKAADVNRFSEAYDASAAKVIEKIDLLAETRTVMRENQIKNDAQAQVNAGKEQLESGFAKIEEAKTTLRKKMQDLVETVFKQSEEKQLIHWATAHTADVDDPKETARYLWITENIRVDLSRSPRDIFSAIVASESISEKLLVAIYKYTQKADPPKIDGGQYDMDAVREALVEKAVSYAEDFQRLSDACVAWDEGHTAYIAGLETYREKMGDLQPCRWLSFDGKGNASFTQLIVGSQNFANLKTTFSMMFVFVGALVIFATIGKMVDEQRTLVGTTKALGFFNREIFAKYLSFGVFATLIGTLLGALIARFLIAPFLLNGFNEYYRFDVSKTDWNILATVIVFVAGLLLATLAVWLACNRLLREPAVRLMQAKTPGQRKGSAKKGKRVLSLYSRLILLNMRTDLKRVIVTIVSIMGCCALVIIGVTLRSAVHNAVKIQYSEIVDYDICVEYDPAAAVENGREIRQALDAEKTAYTNIYSASATYRINDLQIAELFCGNLEEINNFYHLNDYKTGEPIEPTDRGVLVQRRIAETCGLDVGSEFEISIGATKTATVRVAGIFENYVGRIIVFSGSYYEKIYNEPFEANAFMVRYSEQTNAEKLSEDLRALDGYTTMTKGDESKSIIETSTSMLDTVVLLFIGIAAVMAGVVQLNLTNMYVLQKKRELTIMRINGFTVKEVIGYMLRETILTTILGILFGIAAGTGVAYSIVRTLEQSFLKLDRTPDLIAWLCGAVLTIVFTVIVNAIALRNVKNLRLTDVA